MKLIRIFLYLCLIAVLVSVIYGYTLPDSLLVERHIVADATREVVYEQVNQLKNWEKWSPWYAFDPEMEIVYEGPVSGVGAKYFWSSTHPDVGSGKLSLIVSIPYDSIAADVSFGKVEDVLMYFAFDEKGLGKTQIVWGIKSFFGYNPFKRIFGKFMESAIAPDLEAGLAKLANYSAGLPRKLGLGIEEVTLGYQLVASTRLECSREDFLAKLAAEIKGLRNLAKKYKLEEDGSPFAVFHKLEPDRLEVEIGIPYVSLPEEPLPPPYLAYENQSVRVIEAEHKGPWATIEETHLLVQQWIAHHGFDITAPYWEVYETIPGQEEPPERRITKIYYPIK